MLAYYQEGLDSIVNRSARRLLKSTNLGLGEVAFLLGFEDVNSFMCAFHVWGRNHSGEMASERRYTPRRPTKEPLFAPEPGLPTELAPVQSDWWRK